MRELTPSELQGAWTLRSFFIQPPTGDPIPWGENISGLLIYTRDGYMSLALNRAVPGNPENPTPAEIFEATLLYAGTYELRPPHQIFHRVLNASDPTRIGQELLREARFEKDHLVLTGHGDFGTATLTWSRASSERV